MSGFWFSISQASYKKVSEKDAVLTKSNQEHKRRNEKMCVPVSL